LHVVHCDIKPENILLDPHDEVWLADFGIAFAIPSSPEYSYTRQVVRGAPQFAAPEQIRGNPLHASDQYSLAVMVYEWLCGQLPFHGSALQPCSEHKSTPPPRMRDRVPSISGAVERVVLKALSNVLEFATALEQASKQKGPLLLQRLVLR
jgi:serine/threonine protein kinase